MDPALATEQRSLEAPKGLSANLRNRLIIYVAILAVANYMISGFKGDDPTVTHLDGRVAAHHEVQRAVLMTLFVTIQLVGFMLGALVSLIPFRQWSYGQKYLGASLLCMIVLHGLALVAGLLGLVLR